MSSLFSGIGVSSGLDIAGLIEQLLSAQAQRRVPIETRLSEIAQTRAALQQSRSLLLALRSSASTLALPSTLSATSVFSSMPGVLSALASGDGIGLGSTSLLVRSLASASRFVSSSLTSTTTALGASAMTMRFGSGRLDDDRSLALLHGGAGIARGQIRVTDRNGKQATIDLRDALSIGDVLAAFNSQDAVEVEARLRDDGRGLEIVDTSLGTGTLKITEWSGGATAASLGILGNDLDGDGTITGSTLAELGNSTPLWSLRGGVPIVDGEPAFTILIDDKQISIDLGAGASGSPPRAATLGDALARIEQALSAAGVSDQLSITIAPSGDRLRVTSTSAGPVSFALPASSTSLDGGVIDALGLPTNTIPASGGGTSTIVDGARVLFGMNDVGLDRLDGGVGLKLSGSMTIVDRAGRSATVNNLEQVDSIQLLMTRIRDAAASVPGMDLEVGLDAGGSRLRISDLAGGSGSVSVAGSAADQLGLTTLQATAGGASTIQSRDLRRADIGWGTPLSHLSKSALVGSFQITTASGAGALITVTAGMTVNDLARAVEATGLPASVRINALGDAIEVVDESGTPGALSVVDETGGVAAALRIAGTSSTGRLDGTRTVSLSLDGSESATQLVTMLNELAGVDAQLVDDGNGGAYMMLTASMTGLRNGLVLAVDGVDLGLAGVTAARDARILLNPSIGNGILVTADTNLLTGVIPGVSLELKAVSPDAVTVTVSPSLQPLKNGVASLVATLTAAMSQLRSATAVDIDAGTRGALYGNATASRARDALRSLVGSAFGPDGMRLSSIGITVGADGAVNFDESKLTSALESDPDAVRDMIAGDAGLAPRFESLLAAIVEPSLGTIDGDDARLGRVADNANARIDRIDLAIERRRAVLIARFAAMEAAIERLRWQQSTLESVLAGMGGS